MDVSIIIVNYNTVSLLIDSIDSIFTQTSGISYEIIVVDNASADNSAFILRERFGLNIQYISLDKNIGFGKANNVGIKQAKGRNIFLLNPDTVVENNAVKILSDYLDENTNVGIVGANLYNKDGSFQASFSNVYPSIGYELGNLLHVFYFFDKEHINYTAQPKEVKSVVGAAMMVKYQVIRQTGAFNPQFFMYSEEEEWCYRTRLAGFKIFNIPEAKIKHLDGQSFNFSADRQKRRIEGLRTLYCVSYSPTYCKIIRGLEYLTIVSRLLTFTVLNKKEKIIFWRFMYKNRRWD